MPLSRYDSKFGGKSGAATKAFNAMKQQYGEERGEKIFYATKNSRAKKMASKMSKMKKG